MERKRKRTRKFGGKRYTFDTFHQTKQAAQKRALDLRESDYRVRVEKYSDGYAIFTSTAKK